jgi:hypothetical protein
MRGSEFLRSLQELYTFRIFFMLQNISKGLAKVPRTFSPRI